MKYIILEWFRKALATVTAVVVSLTGGIFGGEAPLQRPDENSVTAYGEENADYRKNSLKDST